MIASRVPSRARLARFRLPVLAEMREEVGAGRSALGLRIVTATP